MLPPALGSSANAVASLYRAFAREIENLPTRYLREFYKIKVKDDIRALPTPVSPTFKARYKRVSKELKKLEAANNGNTAAYKHILSLAYGRKGKLRWELMEPLLSDPSAPLPPPIIPSVESSRPPVYSPEVAALLASALSRHGSSTRTAKQLRHPPTLPARADPKSSDAKILGPLSKRREVNLRWRFFEEETARVQPPIEVTRVHTIQPSAPLDNSAETKIIEQTDAGNVGQPTPLSVGFQGTSVFRDLESVASPNPNPPKRASDPSLPNPTNNNTLPTPTVNRFIRRQHRKLLRKIPILTYLRHPKSPVGKYQVSLSPLAYSRSLIGLTSTVPMADEADLAWLRLPPPPREPGVEPEPQPSPVPKVKVKPMAETKQGVDKNTKVGRKPNHTVHTWSQESNRVGSCNLPGKPQHRPRKGASELKVETKPKVEEQPKVEIRPEAKQKPHVYVKLKRTIRSPPPRSNWVDEPPDQLNHHPGDRPQRNPSRPGLEET